MKPEKQRIKIAEACGWAVHPKDKWIVIPPNSPHSVQPLSTIPDYLNDLNAMHEAEKLLGELQSRNYILLLQEVCSAPAVGYVVGYTEQVLAIARVCHATAPQRAEAFLKTLGLWEEQQ